MAVKYSRLVVLLAASVVFTACSEHQAEETAEGFGEVVEEEGEVVQDSVKGVEHGDKNRKRSMDAVANDDDDDGGRENIGSRDDPDR